MKQFIAGIPRVILSTILHIYVFFVYILAFFLAHTEIIILELTDFIKKHTAIREEALTQQVEF
jgi:hypothetical protein